jgi:hypothetical protein
LGQRTRSARLTVFLSVVSSTGISPPTSPQQPAQIVSSLKRGQQQRSGPPHQPAAALPAPDRRPAAATVRPAESCAALRGLLPPAPYSRSKEAVWAARMAPSAGRTVTANGRGPLSVSGGITSRIPCSSTPKPRVGFCCVLSPGSDATCGAGASPGAGIRITLS